MIRRIATAAVLIPLVLAALYLAPAPLFLALVSGVVLLALHEYGGLLNRHDVRLHAVMYVAGAALPWVVAFRPDLLFPFLLLSLLAVMVAGLVLHGDPVKGILDSAGNLFGVFYIALPMSLLQPLRGETEVVGGPRHDVLAVMLAVWASDSMAYFVGRAIGKRRLLPRLSPGKTLEGFVAGLLAPAILLVGLGPWLLPGHSPAFLAVAGLVLAVAAIAGDLFESLLKRSAGVKDSSQLLPGHGGALDRIDSLLAAFPAWYLLLEVSQTGRLYPW